jgi:AraC-like DNA-binding protein
MLPPLDADALSRLLDPLPGVVFFVKDRAGRYLHANLSLVRRLGLRRREDVLGRCASELFPGGLGCGYAEQDRRVLSGESLHEHLELHLYPNRRPGWCLSSKFPLRVGGEIVGLVGSSRDLDAPDRRHPQYAALRRALDRLQADCGERVRIADAAAAGGLSQSQFERLCRKVFGLSPQQLLGKHRIDLAMRLLAGNEPIARIAQACGFADHSAFTRQFRSTLGLSPSDYRRLRART